MSEEILHRQFEELLNNLGVTNNMRAYLLKISKSNNYKKIYDLVDEIYNKQDRMISIKYKTLISLDNKLKNIINIKFTNNKTLGTHFTDKWDKLLGNLGNLQGLILIKKANKGCDELLIELLKVLDDKIVAVNKIVQLNEDLYTTSSS